MAGDDEKESLESDGGEITAHDKVEVQERAENPEELVIDEPREDDFDATDEAEVPNNQAITCRPIETGKTRTRHHPFAISRMV